MDLCQKPKRTRLQHGDPGAPRCFCLQHLLRRRPGRRRGPMKNIPCLDSGRIIALNEYKTKLLAGSFGSIAGLTVLQSSGFIRSFWFSAPAVVSIGETHTRKQKLSQPAMAQTRDVERWCTYSSARYWEYIVPVRASAPPWTIAAVLRSASGHVEVEKGTCHTAVPYLARMRTRITFSLLSS